MGNWEKQVLKAVSEVLSHPNGGRVDVIIHTQAVSGERRISINPSLVGITKKTVIHNINDDED